MLTAVAVRTMQPRPVSKPADALTRESLIEHLLRLS